MLIEVDVEGSAMWLVRDVEGSAVRWARQVRAGLAGLECAQARVDYGPGYGLGYGPGCLLRLSGLSECVVDYISTSLYILVAVSYTHLTLPTNREV